MTMTEADRIGAMMNQAQQAAVSVELVPLHVSQNMARAVIKVMAVHHPKLTSVRRTDASGKRYWKDDHLMCAGCSADFPCATISAIGAVLA